MIKNKREESLALDRTVVEEIEGMEDKSLDLDLDLTKVVRAIAIAIVEGTNSANPNAIAVVTGGVPVLVCAIGIVPEISTKEKDVMMIFPEIQIEVILDGVDEIEIQDWIAHVVVEQWIVEIIHRVSEVFRRKVFPRKVFRWRKRGRMSMRVKVEVFLFLPGLSRVLRKILSSRILILRNTEVVIHEAGGSNTTTTSTGGTTTTNTGWKT